ncbi:MAG: IS21 family transposase [Candidatus Binatia bacterium]
MAAERIPMRKLREVLRLRLDVGLPARAIARSCRLSVSTVSGYLGRIAVAKLVWPLPPELDDDAALTRLLFPSEGQPVRARPEPDWAAIHQELHRPHVTKLLVWQEYREREPDGYQYSQFCARYAVWARTLPVTLRQTHRAGAKGFVDFSGDGLTLVDPITGARTTAVLFVLVLGASNLTYVEPVLHQDLATWITCHVNAFRYFGGVPAALVPDNTKAGVARPCYYDPELNPTYAELAQHYGTAVLPARPYKPRDKAKVEQAVLLAERWILAVLRDRVFPSLADLHDAIVPLQERLNARPLRRLGQSRRQLFEAVERAALRPLPATPYVYAVWARPKVSIDYHVAFEDHYYSVPYQLRGEVLDLRATATTVELFHDGRRVASHLRSHIRHHPTTEAAHMPAAHRAHLEWTPSRLIGWGATVGPGTAALFAAIMEQRPHPEQGYRACLGIMRLAKHYPGARLERACARALHFRACSYKSVVAILRHHRDAEPLPTEAEPPPLPLHANVRGAKYYH